MEKNECLLAQQRCVPCQGGVLPLGPSEVNALLLQLNSGWQVNVVSHLHKKYLFMDFLMPIKFVNLIAILAEKEGYHPEISIGWGHCTVEMWTHKVDGLTPSDFYMAAKIEKEFSTFKK